MASENPHILFPYLPAKPAQVYYRIPYLFLPRKQERISEAVESVSGLTQALKKQAAEEVREDGGKRTWKIADQAVVEMETGEHDLWIRTEWFTDTPPACLAQAESAVLGLEKPVYKYIHQDAQVLAFPLASGAWASDLKGYIGLDAGSISINIAFADEAGIVLETDYTYTEGDVINNIKKGFAKLSEKLPANAEILGSGVTGSGHEISYSLLNADVYETELDAHAEAALHLLPDAQVIFDIGGQDSKVMYIEDGELGDAGMNKKCGAGTGAFLDAQADRLGIPIEKFGETGLRAKKPYSFSSMCTVFVGRDLIAEQAKGNTKENIIAGLHRSLAMNFFSTLGINKKRLKTPIAFQGGVASNSGVKKSLEALLYEARGEKVELFVPMHHKVMGAIGMALFARDEAPDKIKFRGIETIRKISSVFTECTRAEETGCGRQTLCDLVHLYEGDTLIETLYACEKYYSTPSAGSEESLKTNYGG
ncbi:MAG: acyl-CoA dehydratase activase [Desulfosalsimonadaceae bacterium]